MVGMRPLTNSEYKKMREQSESRLSSMSEIALNCHYVDNTVTPNIDAEWQETGFAADFRIMGFGYTHQTGAGVPVTVNEMTATCVIPSRYFTGGKSFISKQAPIDQALGKPFGLAIERSGTQFLVNGQILCNSLSLVSVHNTVPTFFTKVNWTLMTEPIVMPDAIFLQLHATETLSVRTWMDANFVGLPKHGFFNPVTGTVEYIGGVRR